MADGHFHPILTGPYRWVQPGSRGAERDCSSNARPASSPSAVEQVQVAWLSLGSAQSLGILPCGGQHAGDRIRTADILWHDLG